MRTLFIAFLVVAGYHGYPQQGDFPIKDHVPAMADVDHSSHDIVFDDQGLMYVATRAGLLRYDGSHWEYIHTPASAFSLAVGPENRVYAGCTNSFGFLELTLAGLEYVSVSPDTLDNETFSDIHVMGDSILFLSKKSLWVYSGETLNRYGSPDRFDMVSLVFQDGKAFINTEIASYEWNGVTTRESDTWIGKDYPPLKVQGFEEGDLRLFVDLEGDMYGKRGNGKPFPVKNAGSNINDFSWINDTLFVTSTRDHGCFILTTRNFERLGKADYQSGLPDNEITALEVDWGMGIWVAHEFGFSRIDPMAPVRCLSNHEGLDGNLLQSATYQGQLMAGTSSGLFRLVRDSVFSITTPAQRLFSKTQATLPNRAVDQQKQDRAFEYVKWVYERVPGIITKCNKLQLFGNALLIGTNDGLFEYDGKYITRIFKGPVNDIIPVPKTNEFLVIDNNHKVSRYVRDGSDYTQLPFGYDESPVLTACGDRKSYVWLISPGKIISTGMTIYGASALEMLDFPNHYFEKPTVMELGGKLYFITGEGYFYYDYQQQKIAVDTALNNSLGIPKLHFKDGSSFWVFDGKVWRYVNADGEATTFPYLSLYPDIRFIHRDADGEVFFITSSNHLYKYSREQDRNEVYQSHIFYKYLFAKSAYYRFKKLVSLNYDENYFKAELSQPDYLGLLNVEFQYQVKGMDNDWSEWSTDNKIDLNFIPDGEYELRVRSRDIFGRVQASEPITLRIKPPYWKTTWFYLLEVAFFAGLVLISTRLNQRKAQNRFLTEGLTILTIVIIIETLQSLAQSWFNFSSSPIFDFLVNLSVALIIFPMEILLKRMIKSGFIPIKINTKSKKKEKKADAMQG